ncbi:MAG: murein L,D-transpeptidase catalytic domain-containing protein [Ginsengibacter sp.]
MAWLRYPTILLLASAAVVLLLTTRYYHEASDKTSPGSISSVSHLADAEISKINIKVSELEKFASDKKFSRKFIFFVDMSLPSGKNRFFVYDLAKDSIVKTSLVAHGSGNSGFSITPKFSNQKESSCTALGKYRIGKSYAGRFGTAYKLYGLDSSNSNAFSRYIVLHSYSCVPEQETYPLPICNSRGCPMVSLSFLKQLENIINRSKEPVLLWIFN